MIMKMSLIASLLVIILTVTTLVVLTISSASSSLFQTASSSNLFFVQGFHHHHTFIQKRSTTVEHVSSSSSSIYSRSNVPQFGLVPINDGKILNRRIQSSQLLLSSRAQDATNAMRDMRKEISENEDANLIMQALRGTNLNDDDQAVRGMEMKLVNINNNVNKDIMLADDMELPYEYNPIILKNFFQKRPIAIITRIIQLTTSGGGYISRLLLDQLQLKFNKQTKISSELEIQRTKELRDLLTSLGPFYIKIGQALSIRPDILSPRAMVELQKLCDKVPSFDSTIAFQTIENELNQTINELYTTITSEPVAAASLGQVYKAVLRSTNETVAVKVQRPNVLETVSLDLYLVREIGIILRSITSTLQIQSRIDIVDLLDEFAYRFYQELDYNLECANGIRMEKDMKCLYDAGVQIPKNYIKYTSRRVHTAEWIYGEKLSQSTANDVSSLVNLGVITYLTQLLDSGFFHADPHPGNMLRTDDGKLAIIDFGLMTEITNDQKYGMIEAIAHLIQRDYSEIGQDFINLDFIPKGTDTRPIVPALTKVFDVALAGGGAKSINFQDLAADLAQITFDYPFRIPPYFALVIRAISVLEGIALVGNPNFAIIDEAYPYIARKLMTDKSPRLRKALRYMIYGKDDIFEVENVIDLLQALEKFTAIRDDGDGTAFKVDGVRGDKNVGTAGDFIGSKKVEMLINDDDDTIDEYTKERFRLNNNMNNNNQGAIIKKQYDDDQSIMIVNTQNDERTVRDALRFFFSPEEGEVFREFILEEIVTVVDASSRSAILELIRTLNLGNIPLPSIIRAFTPELSKQESRMIQQITKLVQFLIGIDSNTNNNNNSITSFATTTRLRKLIPVMREYSPQLREFGILLLARLTEKAMSRGLTWATGQLSLFDSSSSSTSNNNNKSRFNQRSFIQR